MITIAPLSTIELVVWKDLLGPILEDWGALVTKPESGTIKQFKFSFAVEYENWFLFTFQDVDISIENFNIGNVCMSNEPGEWTFIVQTKTQLSSSWTSTYADLAYVKPINQIINSYDV